MCELRCTYQGREDKMEKENIVNLAQRSSSVPLDVGRVGGEKSRRNYILLKVGFLWDFFLII